MQREAEHGAETERGETLGNKICSFCVGAAQQHHIKTKKNTSVRSTKKYSVRQLSSLFSGWNKRDFETLAFDRKVGGAGAVDLH